MTAAEFKVKARKRSNGGTVWAFGEDPRSPNTAGVRRGKKELSFVRPTNPENEGAVYEAILQGLR